MDRTLHSAQAALDIPLRYAQAGTNLARAALAGARQCIEMEHYPRRDVIDAAHATRYFYHAHGSLKKPLEEHGHFHVFVYRKKAFSHLIGISLNAMGHPIRLFTTNRWVTGEQWQSAQALQLPLQSFALQTRGRMAPVARWVEAMMLLYSTQISQLLQERDAVMQAKALHQDWESLAEDRRLDVVTQRKISLTQTIQQLGC
jgi:hypothetical protein